MVFGFNYLFLFSCRGSLAWLGVFLDRVTEVMGVQIRMMIFIFRGVDSLSVSLLFKFWCARNFFISLSCIHSKVLIYYVNFIFYGWGYKNEEEIYGRLVFWCSLSWFWYCEYV